jgi:peptide/nickel transport system substrate-binding protein
MADRENETDASTGIVTEEKDGKRIAHFHVDRRKLMAGAGGGLMAALAGCQGDGGGDGTTTAPGTTATTTSEPDTTTAGTDPGTTAPGTTEATTTETTTTETTTVPEGTPIDNHFDNGGAVPLAAPNYNRAHKGGSNIIPACVIFTWPMKYYPANGEWVPNIIDSYEADGTSWTFNINTDFTWHNDGSSVTAEDFITTYYLKGTVTNIGHWQYFENQSAPDESTWEVELNQQLNPDLFLNILFSRYRILDFPTSYWREDWEQPLRNAREDGDDALEQQLLNEMSDHLWNPPFGNGPFEHDRVQGSTTYCTKYEDYPYADQINFDEMSFTVHSGDQQLTADMVNNRLDGRYGGGRDLVQTARDNGAEGWEYRTAQSTSLSAMAFNLQNEQWAHRGLRQAMAYLTPTDRVREAINPGNTPAGYPTVGMPGSILERYFNPDEILEDYMPGSVATDEATRELEAAGFTQDGGTWMTPDGENVQVNQIVQSDNSDTISAFQIVNDVLGDFGFETNLQTLENTAYYAQLRNNEFEVAHPGFNVRDGIPYNGFNWSLSESVSAFTGLPTEVELPEVGDVNGDMAMTITLSEELAALAAAQEESVVNEQTTRLAWTLNQLVPKVAIGGYGTSGVPITTDEWNWPEEGHPMWSTHRPVEWAPHQGHLSAKTEEQ